MKNKNLLVFIGVIAVLIYLSNPSLFSLYPHSKMITADGYTYEVSTDYGFVQESYKDVIASGGDRAYFALSAGGSRVCTSFDANIEFESEKIISNHFDTVNVFATGQANAQKSGQCAGIVVGMRNNIDNLAYEISACGENNHYRAVNIGDFKFERVNGVITMTVGTYTQSIIQQSNESYILYGHLMIRNGYECDGIDSALNIMGVSIIEGTPPTPPSTTLPSTTTTIPSTGGTIPISTTTTLPQSTGAECSSDDDCTQFIEQCRSGKCKTSSLVFIAGGIFGFLIFLRMM